MDENILEKDKAYHAGFLAGLECFAIWKNGIQRVGDPGMTLREAKYVADTLWNYDPRKGE